MRVGIDLSLACKKSPRGIGVFEKSIGLPHDDFLKKNSVYVFGVGKKPSWISDKVKYVNLFIYNPILREQILLPIFIYIYRIKRLHVFANAAPFLLLKSHCKIFITIHDVSYRYSREYMKKDKRQNTIKRRVGLAYHSIMLKPTCRYAEKIFTVSDWSAGEINKQTSYNYHQKISIIPNTCDNNFLSAKKPDWNDKPDRLLLVTGAHPQKNLVFFLDCYIELCRTSSIKTSVDIVGVCDHEVSDKYIRFKKFQFHGMVSQKKLVDFYDNARLLIMPSLYESFGIPLIEAKYRGLWVLSSDGGASKEIALNYATFFNPKNKNDFLKKLRDILFNKVKNPTKHYTHKYHQENISKLYWSHVYD